jgi:hypothetical protein
VKGVDTELFICSKPGPHEKPTIEKKEDGNGTHEHDGPE